MPNEYGKYTAKELRDMKVNGIISVPVSSTCVDTLSYDLLTGVLVVTLNSMDDFAYLDFPFDEFVKFVNGEGTGGSIGSFYNYFVKGHYAKAY